MSNKRIALNTAATYLRTLLSAGLALFGSRWVLESLGVIDFGLYSVVGSLILFITFLNTVLAFSVSRHFAFSIGQGDHLQLNRWFNAALSIHLVLAVALVLVGLLAGQNVVGRVLAIPAERVTACLWIFRVSLFSAFVSMVSVPFVAMFTARQRMAETAAWGVVQAALVFALAWLLRFAPGDRLLFYSVGMALIIIFIQAAQVIRAISVFAETRVVPSLFFDADKVRGVLSFAVWNLIGGSGALFRDQGSSILLNLFFGPSANAAYGIATQISNQGNQLSTALVGSFSPEITASEGRGDRARMLALAERASRFGAILAILVAIPLIVEMDYILKLWLRIPPQHTVMLCQMILCVIVIDRLSTGYMLAVQAHGKIAGYQATLGGCLLLTLPLAWLFLNAGHPPTSIGIAFIITIVITSVGRVIWGQRLLGMSITRWLATVVLPSALVASVAAIAALAPRWLLPPSLPRLMLVFSFSIALSLLATWLFATTAGDRQCVLQILEGVRSKLGLRSLSPVPPEGTTGRKES